MWKTQALSKEMCLHQRLQARYHPATRTYIPPWSCQKLNKVVLRMPRMQCNVKGDGEALSLTTMKETEWLNHMKHNVQERQRGYATHCCQASWKWSIIVCLPRRTTETRQPARCQSSLLPLLAEAAHSIAMIKHGITAAMKAVEHLNQGQTAVIAFDQPIFGLAKEIP